ncbi:arf-GAP with dual PH domain-containing protein 1-like [Antedon mediterranea]|uniref:arf-GAP with dual PH domain-containing protein 1-like n=1 Tax=Antedon mediterranea TaxID=105859 RepID=UPI003AF84AC1
MTERNKNRLLDLLTQEGNNVCADCGCQDPDWASFNLGIYLCVTCAQIHRMLGAHISKVKSIRLDQWNDDQVEFMAANGNQAAKAKYELCVPASYKRPTERDCQVLREQWIRAKYERHEFMDVDKQTYLSGHKTGYLWKRLKGDSRFQSRLFVLSEEENVIKYYNKQDAKEPKAAIKLSNLNAVFVPDKIGNPNGLQISWLKEGITRNIYLYTDDGKDIVEWYNAIRHANYNRLKVAYPGSSDDELSSQLSRDFIKEGWLSKSGPRGVETYRKRWMTLDGRRLLYFQEPLEPHPRGEVFLGNKLDGYFVRDGLPPGKPEEPPNSFSLITPDREYYFSAESVEEQKSWMEALKAACDKPMYPQDKKK